HREQRWAVLAVETAYFIRKLRCERVIRRNGRDFSASEVSDRWHTNLDRRMTLERRSTARAYGKLALKPTSVSMIRGPVLENCESLPPDWVTKSGVLVGIRKVDDRRAERPETTS
ncbi:hypothetical protein BD309DRAFT_869713, partial [Dichomitus squalens]